MSETILNTVREELLAMEVAGPPQNVLLENVPADMRFDRATYMRPLIRPRYEMAPVIGRLSRQIAGRTKQE